MQHQAPSYRPTNKKRIKGVRIGNQVTSNQSRSAVVKKQRVRKTSPYSKNRSGVKTTKTPGMKGSTMNQPMAPRVPVQSNSPGAFPFSGVIM